MLNKVIKFLLHQLITIQDTTIDKYDIDSIELSDNVITINCLAFLEIGVQGEPSRL